MVQYKVKRLTSVLLKTMTKLQKPVQHFTFNFSSQKHELLYGISKHELI